MKLGFLFLLLGLMLFNASAFGELSVEDIEKIRAIVKEIVAQEIAKVTGKIDGITGRIDRIDKQLDRNFALILALIAFMGVVIGLPQFLERKKDANKRGRLRCSNNKFWRNSGKSTSCTGK